MRQIYQFIRSNLITSFVLLIISASFIYQAGFRNQHFQECDSAGVYYLLYGFPQSGLNFTALTYQNSKGLVSEELAKKILDAPSLSQIFAPILNKYPKEFILEKLTHTGLVSGFRYGLITLVAALPLPHQLQSALALPLSSTYSPAPGLLYGLVTTSHTGYESFISRITLLNLLFFHFSVALIFFALLKNQVSKIAAALAAFAMLFSISLYSSGFNLGSVVWMIFSGSAWLYILSRYREHPKLNRFMAITSAALIFFNYLIGLFWLAFILAKYFTGSPKPRFLDLLKTQKIAIATFAICGVLFYPPGQGLRSVTSLPTFASDFYYTVLNYFSWYNQSILFDRLQFLAGLLILVCSFIYLIRAAGKKELIPATLIFIWIIYLAAALFKVLGFGPIRQMLFLSPAIFFAAGAMLGRILPAAEKTPAKIVVWAFLIFIPAAGFFTVSLRHKAAADISKNLAVDADVTKIGIHDCSFNRLYKKWPSRAQVDFINPKSLNKNDTVLYLSQTIPFQTAMQSWQKNWQIDYNILSSQNLITGTYFMAYNPSLERFGFTRPNNVYEVKFKVNQITPK